MTNSDETHINKKPMSKIRRQIGKHMQKSKLISPHVLTAMEVDYENVEKVRKTHGANWKKSEKYRTWTHQQVATNELLPAIMALVIGQSHEFTTHCFEQEKYTHVGFSAPSNSNQNKF